MKYRPGLLLLSLALLGVVSLFVQPSTDGKALAADPPEKTQPGKEPSPGEDEPPLNQEPMGKHTLVLDNNAHTGPVLGLFFRPDRRELLSASRDSTIRSWDLDTGELIRVIRPHLAYVGAVAFARDGHAVAVSGWEGNECAIHLINLDTDKVKTFKSPSFKRGLAALALSHDGKWLAGSGNNQNLLLFDVEKESLHKEWTLAGSLAHELAFHWQTRQDMKSKKDVRTLMLMSDAQGEKPRLWPVPNGNQADFVQGPDKAFGLFGVSPNDKHLVLAGPDGLTLWDIEAKKAEMLTNSIGRGWAFSADSQKLLFSYKERMEEKAGVKFRDLASGKMRDLTSGKDKTYLEPLFYGRGALSADGKLGAVVDPLSDEMVIFNTDDGKKLHRLAGRAVPPYGVAWSPDGNEIAFGFEAAKQTEDRFQGRTPVTRAFSLDTMKYVAKLPPDKCQRAILQRDDQTLDTAPGNKVVVKRGAVTEKEISFPGHPLCATFVAKGQVVIGTVHVLELFDTHTGNRLCKLIGHGSGVVAVAPSKDGKYLLSAGQDMTLRIWDLERARAATKDKGVIKPIQSLFFAKNRSWISWSPEGYFAASPDGEQLMGWQVDNGPGKLLSYYTAEQFKAFNRPKVISLLRQEGSIEKALWVADKAREPIAVADVLPPKVTITSPSSSAVRLDKPDLTIEAFAESSGKDPVTSLQLMLDGRPLASETARQAIPNPQAGKSAPVSWKVQIPPGRHRLSIDAQTEKSSGTSEEIWVTNATRPAQPRLFVLLIGIDKYVNFNKLNCAVQDAEALEKAFLTYAKGKTDLFGDVQTKLIKDSDATKKGILAGLDWLKDVQEQDVVVVFYAGHGDKDKKDQFHLVAVDAEAEEKLSETAVSGAEFKARLAALKSRRVLVLLDACHSGAIGMDDLARDLKRSDCGVAVLCAAEGTEVSRENQKEGHGYFTKWLLSGLQGGLKDDATKNAAGEVTLARLYAFVQERVPQDTQDQQHPVLVGLAAIRSFALAKP